MKKLVAILVVGGLAMGPGCATPHTTLTFGVAAVVTSALVIASVHDEPCPHGEPACAEQIAATFVDGFSVLFAGALGLTGLGFIASGSVSLYEEHLDEQKRLKAALPTSSPGATPRIASPAHTPGRDRLVAQIRIAARANRCPASEAMRAKLIELDAPLANALVSGDEYVAYCASWVAYSAAPTRL
jgi:hypothetical protein